MLSLSQLLDLLLNRCLVFQVGIVLQVNLDVLNRLFGCLVYTLLKDLVTLAHDELVQLRCLELLQFYAFLDLNSFLFQRVIKSALGQRLLLAVFIDNFFVTGKFLIYFGSE